MRALFYGLMTGAGFAAGHFFGLIVGLCIGVLLLPPSLDPAIRLKEWVGRRGLAKGGLVRGPAPSIRWVSVNNPRPRDHVWPGGTRTEAFGLMPGETYPVIVKRTRRWWQLWRPKTWTERAVAVVPFPDHPNCRCTIVPAEETEHGMARGYAVGDVVNAPRDAH